MQEQVLFNAHIVGGAQSELGLFLVITAPSEMTILSETAVNWRKLEGHTKYHHQLKEKLGGGNKVILGVKAS